MGIASMTFGIGCDVVLGVEALDFKQVDGGAAASKDGSIPGPAAVECMTDSQCALPALEGNAQCAVALCKNNTCKFRAKDGDGDGLTVRCTSRDPQKPIAQSTNIDCDDTQAGVVTGTEVDCSDGTFTLPGIGTCRAGKARCQADGTLSACAGVVGKRSKELCDNLDDDCDGTVDNGCPCSPGATQPCGPLALAGKGICRAGTQTCVAGGTTWGACSGAVTPAARNCLTGDNDCNGTTDGQEAACLCDGQPAGAMRACATGLVGACAPGKQTCAVTATNASWGGCVGDIPQPPRQCSTTTDNNCDGVPDQSEAGCKCDGLPLYSFDLCPTDASMQRVCVSNAADTAALWSDCFVFNPF
jgi:hypothetical protein